MEHVSPLCAELHPLYAVREQHFEGDLHDQECILVKDPQMDSVYSPPSSGANDFQMYEYDDSNGRVRKVSQSRKRVLSVKKNTFFGALFGLCVVGVCVGAAFYFAGNKPYPRRAVGAITAAFTGQYCRTDKDCVTPGAECFLDNDIIEDESTKAKHMRGGM